MHACILSGSPFSPLALQENFELSQWMFTEQQTVGLPIRKQIIKVSIWKGCVAKISNNMILLHAWKCMKKVYTCHVVYVMPCHALLTQLVRQNLYICILSI